jgi:broad specificity phosphatase PhoE
MQRHTQTEAAVREGYFAAGLQLPEPETDPGLAEFDHHAVFDTFARTHADHPSIAAAREGGLQSFGAMIHHALTAWSQDRLPGVPETWNQFGARARDTLARLQDARGEVLVLSSGGIISRITQAVIGVDDRAAIDLNLSLRNAGLCEFNRRPYGLALSSWNALPHQHDARELWTYY